MRRLVTGVDEQGRSCIVRDRDVAFTEVLPGLSLDRVFALTANPPPPRPHGRGDLVDLGLEPGRCSWMLWRFEPDVDVAMHHTDTVDFDFVVEGAVELVLEDGTHRLAAGDCVVMTGVDHGWRAGPEGCVLATVALGSARRE